MRFDCNGAIIWAGRLIAEPLSLRLGLDQPVMPAATCVKNIAAFNPRSAHLPPETKRIVDALHAICAAPPGTIVMWCGRPHTFVRPHYANPDKGTQLIGRTGAEVAAYCSRVISSRWSRAGTSALCGPTQT